MKNFWLEARKFISLCLSICTLMIMTVPIEYDAITGKSYNYYSFFVFKQGILFPFICMIVTAITFVLLILAHSRIIHPVAALVSSTASFVLSLLYIIIELNASYLPIFVSVLQFGTIVFTFPLLMWLDNDNKKE